MAVPVGGVLGALADPTRLAVFEGLREGARSVGHIAADLPVSRPAVSQHLRVLAEAGLVRSRPAGRQRLYEIDRDGLVLLRAWVEGFWTEVLAAFADHVDAEVRGR